MRLIKSRTSFFQADAVSHSANAPLQIFSWANVLKVSRVLAFMNAAKMVSVVALRGPLPGGQKVGNAMGAYRPRRTVDRGADAQLPVAVGVLGSQPRPAFIGATLNNFGPVAFFKSLGTWAFSHAVIVPQYGYE